MELAQGYIEDFRSGIPETTVNAARGILMISKRNPQALVGLIDILIFIFERTPGISKEGRLGPIDDDLFKVNIIVTYVSDTMLNLARHSTGVFAEYKERIKAVLDSDHPYLKISSVRTTFEYLNQLSC